MMNMETWKFAHEYIGKLWLICRLTLLSSFHERILKRER
ncbi:MAG: SdpI family protein [Lachnospiraceae bacterium]|nr:SdpI family protein [Lachnospiraceae bacterium]MBR2842633.1 SdpI family protein [Lachnospiraceae bacterium]MBR3196288.1 SdpI family protein [Clostridia bacterium]